MSKKPTITSVIDPLCECDNCGHRCGCSKLAQIHNLLDRLDVGGEMPAGDCPKCGCFSYLVKPEVVVSFTRQAGEDIKKLDGCVTHYTKDLRGLLEEQLVKEINKNPILARMNKMPRCSSAIDRFGTYKTTVVFETDLDWITMQQVLQWTYDTFGMTGSFEKYE
jgi:hypothetical protein